MNTWCWLRDAEQYQNALELQWLASISVAKTEAASCSFPHGA